MKYRKLYKRATKTSWDSWLIFIQDWHRTDCTKQEKCLSVLLILSLLLTKLLQRQPVVMQCQGTRPWCQGTRAPEPADVFTCCRLKVLDLFLYTFHGVLWSWQPHTALPENLHHSGTKLLRATSSEDILLKKKKKSLWGWGVHQTFRLFFLRWG